MPRLKRYINGTMGVAPGATSNTDIPRDRRYFALHIFPKAKNAAGNADLVAVTDMIESVRLSVNGVLMLDVKASELLAIADFIGSTAADGELPLYFSEPPRASVLGEEATSWDLFGQSKATLEIKWKDNITVPSVKIRSIFDYSRNVTATQDGKAALFVSVWKVLPKTWNFGAGTNPILDISIQHPIQRIFFLPASGVVSALEVIRDGETVFEGTRAENKLSLEDYELDAEAFGAGAFTYAPDYEQQVSSALVASKSLEFRVTQSEAATLRALIVQRVPYFA